MPRCAAREAGGADSGGDSRGVVDRGTVSSDQRMLYIKKFLGPQRGITVLFSVFVCTIYVRDWVGSDCIASHQMGILPEMHGVWRLIDRVIAFYYTLHTC